MTENINPSNNADLTQLKALMKVIDEISGGRVPYRRVEDLRRQDITTSNTIRKLHEHASDYTFDDGDLVQDLKAAIVELQYLQSIIFDLREKLLDQETELHRLEGLVHREH